MVSQASGGASTANQTRIAETERARQTSPESASQANENSLRSMQQPSATDLRQALDDVQSVISSFASDLRFLVDEDTGRTVVKIVDRETDEVIKQIPSEEMMRIAKALDNLQGLLLRQEA